MNVTEDRKELFKAIAAAQGEFTTVEKSASNPHFKSKFAPLDSIIEMIRPILPKHGLSFVQFTDMSENGNGIIVETVIAHESGQYISGKLFMPSVKQDPQGYGSALTYGKRYGLSAALGIVSDEDIDGNQSEGAERQTRSQQKGQQSAANSSQGERVIDRTPAADGEAITDGMKKTIMARIDKKKVDIAKLHEAFNVQSVDALKKSAINDILAWIDGAAQS